VSPRCARMEYDVSSHLDSILSGTIGHFWPGVERPRSVRRQPERGYLQRAARDEIELTSLDDNGSALAVETHRGRQLPKLVTGATEHGGVLLLEIFGHGSQSRFGGSSASVRHLRARAIVADVSIGQVRSSRLFSVSGHFYGASDWFGVTTSTEKTSFNKKGRLDSYSIHVQAGAAQALTISLGRELVVAPHWSTSGSRDRRTVLAPIEVTCRSSRPKTLWQLCEPILRIQDLISYCFDGFFVADSALAVPDVANAQDLPRRPNLWYSQLMEVPQRVDPPKGKGFPRLRLTELGGFAALRRWLTLCSKHLRAVRPLIEPYRLGKASPPLRMIEVAAAMEYWVAAHKRTSQWAKAKCSRPRHNGCGYAWTLANYVGKPFADWVGDVDKWTHVFWETYNKLKHAPGYSPDDVDLWLLAESGELLLAACLLDRVALTKVPTRSIFGEAHHTWNLREQVRDLLQRI
jgi:hypothetical protein